MRRAMLLATAVFALCSASAAWGAGAGGAGLRGLQTPSQEPARLDRPRTQRARPAGARVQFGVFSTRAVAEERWAELRRRYREPLASRSLVIDRHVVGGRVGYRAAIAGFRNKTQALSFC